MTWKPDSNRPKRGFFRRRAGPTARPLRRLALTSAVTVLATALLVFGVVFWSATRIDQISERRQSQTVESALAKSVQQVPYDQESVAYWDDAVLKLRGPLDLGWIESNLGVWMYDYFKHDRTYVLDGASNVIYAMIDGRTASEFSGPLDPPVADAVADLRKMLATASGPFKRAADVPRVVDLSFFDGRPVLVSAMAIAPETSNVSFDPAQAAILVSVRFLDQSFLTDLAETHQLAGVRFSRTDAVAAHERAFPLTTRTGEIIGNVIWTGHRPGWAILHDVLPVLSIGLAAIAIAVALLIASLRRTYTDLVFSEAESKRRAIHDPLTGLANRGHFNERVTALLDEGRTTGQPIALLFLDLDRFKQVNDTLGHPVGDALIQEVAQRISTTLQPKDLLARIGGDEFAIIKCEGVDREKIEALCRDIVAGVSMPVTVSGHHASVGISIGVAISPEAGTERSELARNADIALYRAKNGGGAGFAFYNEEMSRELRERRALEHDLRRALEGDFELEVLYQPLMSARDLSVSGVEALIRWNHPTLGLVLPPAFISIAEESGLIDQLGERVLREACRTAGALDLDTVAVNVSAAQFHDREFATRLLEILAFAGMEPGRLELEITEGMLLDSTDTALGILRDLRAAGVRIALDDFGTGYSSLSYLIKLEVDRIKLDRSFLQDLGTCRRASSVVSSMIAMARAVGISVTAEGVETEQQCAFLCDAGCDTVQGYLFSPPVPALRLVEQFSIGFRGWSAAGLAEGRQTAKPRVA